MNPTEQKRLERLAKLRNDAFVGRRQPVAYGGKRRDGKRWIAHGEMIFDENMSINVAITLRRIAQKLLRSNSV